jgi:hypothetical protein
MDWQPEQPDPEPDPLERLLAEAQWAEPTREAIGRLRGQWQLLMAIRSPRRRWAWAAAAAAILVAAGLTFWTLSDRGTIGPQPTNVAAHTLPSPPGRGGGGEGQEGKGSGHSRESPSTFANGPQPNPLRAPTGGWSGEGTVGANPVLPKGEATVASNLLPAAKLPPTAVAHSARPPNPYELATLVAYRRTRADRQRRAASGPGEVAAGQRDPVDLAIEQLVAEPSRSVREAAEPLHVDRGGSEATLAARVGRTSGPRQVAAIRLLAEIATPPSLPLLQRLAVWPEVHAEVIRSMGRLSDSPTLGRLSRDEQDPALRRELLSMLLTRNDLRSVRVFLESAEDSHTTADALECLVLVSNPPVEMLFQCLCGPDAEQRMVAAGVLGRLNRPEVSRELIAMVARGMCRQEAMIALLSSSETTAQQFLANAARDPTLSATLWNAKRQFQSLFSWRS